MTDEEIRAFVQQTIQGAITTAVSPLGEQMTGIKTMLTGLTPVAPVTPAPVTPAPVAPVTPAPVTPPPADPALNSQLLEMRRSNEKLVADMTALQEARKADQQRADDAERSSVVNAALNGFQFASDGARQTAVEKVLGQIKRTDAGQLVAGDNLTPEAFIKDWLPRDHAYLLAPVGVGGSGVTPGGRTGQNAPFDLNSIKPGMSAEVRAQAIAAIQQNLPSAS